MKKLDEFRKRKAEQEQELSKLADNITKLQQKRDDLENQINAAIDAANLTAVEKLTETETVIDNRIRSAEKILDRKRETSGLNVDEVIAASNAEMQKYQTSISDVMKEAEETLRLYYKTLIRAGEILQEARAVRNEYQKLVDSRHDDGRFISVSGKLAHGSFNRREEGIIRDIKPDGIILINSLR